VRHLLAFDPSSPALCLVSAHTRGPGATSEPTLLAHLLTYIAKSDVLFTFDTWQTWLGILLSVILAILLLATIVSRPRGARNAFALLVLAMLAIYIFAPASIVGDSWCASGWRSSFALVPLAWIAPRWPQRVTNATATSWPCSFHRLQRVYLTQRYRTMDRKMTELVNAAQSIGTDTVFLPLTVSRAPRGKLRRRARARHRLRGHRKALRRSRQLRDRHRLLSHRQPTPASSPPTSTPSRRRRRSSTSRNSAPARSTSSPATSGRNRRCGTQLLRDYRIRPLRARGTVGAWRWSTPARRSSASSAGGRSQHRSARAPGGVWWNVIQTVRNDGSEPAHIHASGCAAPPCEFDVAAETVAPLSANGSFLVVYAEAKAGPKLAFRTLAERTAPDGSKTSMPMPAVHERDFPQGGH